MDAGVYVVVDGVLVPAATVPGAKGTKGDQGPEGPIGPAGLGVHVGPFPPADPASKPIWVKTTN
jgi:hypothetical protein